MKIGIVGCSIIGSYLAWKLSKGHEVTVFERSKTLGWKPCSGLVSERIWNFIPKDEGLIENRIDDSILHFPKKNVRLKFHPRMMALDRSRLDAYVAKLARECGASILLGNEARKVFLIKDKKPQVEADKMYEFDYLIGCDGSNSIVRKAMDVGNPKFKLGIYAYASKKNKSNFVDVYPSKDGFGWIIPRGQRTEYGFLDKADVARKNFDSFCRLRRIKPPKVYSHIIPQGLVSAEKGRAALCGDALGLTKPISGGGIIWGLTAADMLVSSFPNLGKYDTQVRKFFEPKILFSNVENSIVRCLGRNIPALLPKEAYFDSDIIY